MRHFVSLFLSVAVFAITAGCGSGGGGSSSNQPPPPPPPPPVADKFTLGGTAIGLSGPVTINNGTENLTIETDGEFSFPQKLERSTVYSVTIVSLPNLQLCDVRNSKNFISRDQFNLVVECAAMADANLDLNNPILAKIANQIRIISNYQAKGGLGEPPVNFPSTTIRVFHNTFVSVTTGDNKLIFLTFIDDVSKGGFALNSSTTATALMLLEPSIRLALLDRNYSQSQMDIFLESMAATSEHSQLTALIETIVTDQGFLNLSGGNQSLASALGALLLRAAEYLVQESAFTQQSAPAKPLSPVRKSSSDLVEEISGVRFTRISDTTDSIEMESQNKRQRLVNLSSTLFQRQQLRPEALYDFQIEKPDLLNNTLEVAVNGPGALGSLREANKNAFINASIASVVHEYFLRNLNGLLGLVQPQSFRVGDCFDVASLDSFVSQVATQYKNTGPLLAFNYQPAFRDIINISRARAMATSINDDTNFITQLLSCNKFGTGVFINGSKQYARANIELILALLNTTYLSSDTSVDLLEYPNLHGLGQAISQSYADASWSISNELTLGISVNPSQLAVGEPAEFNGVCEDPDTNTETPCAIVWDFGDSGSDAGSSVQHIYSLPGNYLVNALATGEAGATSQQQLPVKVNALAPNIQVKTATGLNVPDGGTAVDFGSTRFNFTKQSYFVVTNSGNVDLMVDSVTIADENFGLTGANSIPFTLAKGGTENVYVEYSPTSPQQQTAGLTISSNDPDQTLLTVNLSGRGKGEYTLIHSEDGESTVSVTLARTELTYDGGNKTLFFTLYGDPVKDYPQLNFRWRNFDPVANGEGEHEYFLSGPGSECDALVINSDLSQPQAEKNQFCTNPAHADGVFGGSVTLTEGADNMKILHFDFTAVQTPFACLSNCDWVDISGAISFDSQLLP